MKLAASSLLGVFVMAACQPEEPKLIEGQVYQLNTERLRELVGPYVDATGSDSTLFTIDKDGKTQVITDGKTMTLDEYYAGVREKEAGKNGATP